MNDLLKDFRKNGVVTIKNFFTDQEINLLSERTTEIMASEFEFLYLVNNNKINNSFLSKSKFKSLRDEILESCNGKDLKIKTLENFIDFFQPILKRYNLKEFYLEELHGVFYENHLYPEDVFLTMYFRQFFLLIKF